MGNALCMDKHMEHGTEVFLRRRELEWASGQAGEDRVVATERIGADLVGAMTSDDGGLADLQYLAALRALIDERLPALVRQARQDGASWSVVAVAVGMTKQQAWNRFAEPALFDRRHGGLTELRPVVANVGQDGVAPGGSER